jgi:hypothetical protein
MKYMTPDLIARFRSKDDAIAEAGALEWQRACAEYEQHLKDIRAGLPKGVRGFLRRYCLHDARVLALAADEVPYFSIFLRLDKPPTPADRHLELRYRLLGGMKKGIRLTRHSGPAAQGKPLGWWLYDEIDVRKGKVPATTHSILFTGGYELQLTFSTLTCRRLSFVLPAGAAFEDAEVLAPLLA